MEELKRDDFRIHLIIGITGHRDLVPEDMSAVKKKIKEFFDELKRKLPHTPLLLLTPLAEGADRLAAEVAREEGIKYIAPFPLPEDYYKKDFPNTIEKFEELKRDALGYFELPVEGDIQSIKEYGPERDKRYENVGAYVVKHSQILLALWDGKETGLTGGTSQIVKFKLEGLPNEYTPRRTVLDPKDKGPVYHIKVRRIGDLDPSAQYNAEGKWLWPEGTEEKTYFGNNGIFIKFDAFNKAAKDISPKDIEKSRHSLASDDVVNKERFVSHIYAEADVMAINLKKKWHRLLITIIAIAGTLFAIFLGYTYLNIFAFLVAYLAAYLTFYLLFSVFNVTHRFHQSYVEFRVLAEGLRVEFFLRLAGKQEDIADLYLRKHKQYLQWIREVLRSSNVFDPQEKPYLEAIKDYWINGQLNYFSHSSAENMNKVNILRKISNILFIIGLCSAFAAILMNIFNLKVFISLTVLLLISFPSLAALVEIYIDRSIIEDSAEEYFRMKEIFKRANDLWEKSNEDKVSIIVELAKEALRENADWLLLHIHTSEKMPIV
ncbi:MAG: hypothetical protein QW533_07165 [Thermoplasmata archaeon]